MKVQSSSMYIDTALGINHIAAHLENLNSRPSRSSWLCKQWWGHVVWSGKHCHRTTGLIQNFALLIIVLAWDVAKQWIWARRLGDYMCFVHGLSSAIQQFYFQSQCDSMDRQPAAQDNFFWLSNTSPLKPYSLLKEILNPGPETTFTDHGTAHRPSFCIRFST